MNQELSEIVCVIDQSRSMESMKQEAIGGFNAFLEDQKKVPGKARLTLILFDHEYIIVHDGVPLDRVEPLNNETYLPRGTTALRDAIGRAIDTVGDRLSKIDEAYRPGKVIVSILTDGEENASKDYSQERIREMIKTQQNIYNWEFIFLAANQDAFATADSYAIPKHNVANYIPDSAGTVQAFNTISSRTAAYRTSK